MVVQPGHRRELLGAGGEAGEHQRHEPGAAEGVAEGAFVGVDGRRGVAAQAQRPGEHLEFAGVVPGRAGGVGVQHADAPRGEQPVGDVLQGLHLVAGADQVFGLGGDGGIEQRDRPGRQGLAGLDGFEQHRGADLGEDEAVAVGRERLAAVAVQGERGQHAEALVAVDEGGQEGGLGGDDQGAVEAGGRGPVGGV